MNGALTRRMGLVPGQLVGNYRIVKALGEGGMGVVYVGEHVLLGRPAAIKVLRPEHGHVPDSVQRFFAEARTTTAIRHPGIVEVYDFGYTPSGDAFLVMELLAGVSLADRLDAGERLPLAAAIVLARRMALALAAAHDHGVVHRDIKPDNIFLVRDGDGGPVEQVKLLDFGIARLFEDGRALKRTNTGTVMGTPLYMSPEQCRGTGECDHRSDLYSLGCVLFEMLTGERPFHGESLGDLLLAHLSAPAPDVRALVPDVPADIAEIVTWLLAKDPAHRPEHAGALVAALNELIERHGFDRRSSPIQVGWPPRRTPTTVVTGRARGLRGHAIAAGAMVGLGAVIALGLALAGRGPSAPPIAAVDDARPVHAAAPSVQPIVAPDLGPTTARVMAAPPVATPIVTPSAPPRRHRVRAAEVVAPTSDDAPPAVDVDTVVTDVRPMPRGRGSSR